MNFAVIKTGGKQYLVKEGDTLKIEKLSGDFEVGSKVTFEEVLMKAEGDKVEIGAPTIKSKVSAEITKIAKHDTVEVVKYKQKSRYFKKNGHRQPYFEVKITKLA